LAVRKFFLTNTKRTVYIGKNIGTNIGNTIQPSEKRTRSALAWRPKEMIGVFKKTALKSSSNSGGGTRNSAKLINEIVEKIEIGILFGEYKPREHLVQDQLAVRYGAERNVVRAALKKLEERSVTEHFPNRGSAVKEMTAKNAKDLYHLRILLEGLATEKAATQMTPQNIRQLEFLSKEMEENLQKKELRGFALSHEKFHQLIFEMADNDFLCKIIKELISASSSIRYFSYSRYAIKETKKKLLEEHGKMIAFLKKRDISMAGKLARSHIKGGINHYLRSFFPKESLIE